MDISFQPYDSSNSCIKSIYTKVVREFFISILCLIMGSTIRNSFQKFDKSEVNDINIAHTTGFHHVPIFRHQKLMHPCDGIQST